MATVTKKDLIDRIARDEGLKRVTVKNTLQRFLDEVIAELERGNRLEFRDFGVFEVRQRSARRAQNPKTLERLYVPPKNTVRFKPGRLMRKAVERNVAQVSAINGKLDAKADGALDGKARRWQEPKPRPAQAHVG